MKCIYAPPYMNPNNDCQIYELQYGTFYCNGHSTLVVHTYIILLL